MQFIGISANGLLINNLIIYLLNDRIRVGPYLSSFGQDRRRDAVELLYELFLYVYF